MQASEVFNLLRAPAAQNAEAVLRKTWLASQSRPCKDAVVLAMPLRKVPTTLEAFRNAMASNNKGADWVLSSWYVVYVGAADGREWGWSNAPYDSKKRMSDTKPLYSTDADGQYAGQTRFWSFTKVSNNMNKGPRCEQQDGQDLSFVLPAGACFSQFLREDSYGDKPLFCVDPDQHELQPYAPVLLQLSSTNNDQAAKGNGLKIRRVIPVPASVLSAFSDKFYARKQELEEAQQRAAGFVAVGKMVKPMAGCPLACKVDRNAFWYHDEAAQMVEILDSGVDSEMGNKLLLPQDMLLKALHSVDVGRALRMLTVALGHGAVTCVVATEEPGECRVVHLHIDVAETMWLSTLHKSKLIDQPTELPWTSMLKMCFGKSIEGKEDGLDDAHGLKHLRWYAPSHKLLIVTEEGREVWKHIVFEMHLTSKQVSGQRDVAQKAFLMDQVSGPHYVVKIFHVESVDVSEGSDLKCNNPELLLSWQLRPGLGTDVSDAACQTSRKRQYVHADAKDRLCCDGEDDASHCEKKVRFEDDSLDEDSQ